MQKQGDAAREAGAVQGRAGPARRAVCQAGWGGAALRVARAPTWSAACVPHEAQE